MIWRDRNEPPGGGDAADERPSDPGAESVGGRIESIIEAAERAAAEIREDAEQSAREYLADSRKRADSLASRRMQEMSDLSDVLLSRARSVAQQSDDLIAALEEAGRRMIGSAGASPQLEPGAQSPGERPTQESPPPPQAVPPAPPQAAPSPTPESPPTAPSVSAPPPAPDVSPPPVEASPISEGARLLATQMAVAGSSRDEIARRLHEEFGVIDPTPILEEIGAR